MLIKIAIEGEMQLSRHLQSIARNVEEFGPALEKTVDELKETFSGSVFETQGHVINEEWAPLSKAYAYRKAKNFPEAGILEKTGNMRRGFMSTFDSTSARIWNAMTYFKYHQSREPRAKIPRRVMMKLTQNMKQMIVKNFQEYLREKNF